MSVVGLLFSWTSWCGVNKNIPPWCQLWGKQLWWLSYLSLVLPASTVCEVLSDQSCAVLCLNPQMPLAFTSVKPFICPWQVVRKGQDAGWDVCATCAGGPGVLALGEHSCWCCHPPAGIDAAMDFTGSSVLPAVLWHLAYAKFVLCLCSFCLFCISNLCPAIIVTACSLNVGASGCLLESHQLLQNFQYVFQPCTHKCVWSEPII